MQDFVGVSLSFNRKSEAQKKQKMRFDCFQKKRVKRSAKISEKFVKSNCVFFPTRFESAVDLGYPYTKKIETRGNADEHK